MSELESLASHLAAELSRARESLGLPDTALQTPQEMLKEAGRLAGLVAGQMADIEEQLGTLGTTRSAVRRYLSSDSPM